MSIPCQADTSAPPEAPHRRLAARQRGRLRTRPYTVLAAVLFALLAVPFMRKTHSQWDHVYLQASRHLLAGQDIYELRDGYLYPPLWAWLVIPFTFLPEAVARWAWFFVNVAATTLMWRWAWRLSGGRPLEGAAAASWKEHAICWLGLACSLRFVAAAFQNQQTDLVIAALLLGGCLALARSRDMLAATALGVAAAMKGPALLWCPYLVWRGRSRAAAWVACVAIGLNLLPNLVSTPKRSGLWLGEWLRRYVRPMSQSDYYPGIWGSSELMNQSLAGAGYRWLAMQWRSTEAGFEMVKRAERPSPMVVKAAVYGSAALVLLGSWWAMRRGQRAEWIPEAEAEPSRPALEWSVVLLLMPLLSPMSSKPHFCPVLLPGFCLARWAVCRGDRVIAALLVVAIALGIASTIDVAGDFAASVAMWYGAVSAEALLLLLGCWWALVRMGLGVTGESCPIKDEWPVTSED